MKPPKSNVTITDDPLDNNIHDLFRGYYRVDDIYVAGVYTFAKTGLPDSSKSGLGSWKLKEAQSPDDLDTFFLLRIKHGAASFMVDGDNVYYVVYAAPWNAAMIPALNVSISSSVLGSKITLHRSWIDAFNDAIRKWAESNG